MRFLIVLFFMVCMNCFANPPFEATPKNENEPIVCVGINDTDNKIEKLIIGSRFVINGKPYEFAEHKEHDDYMLMRSERIDGQDKYYFYLYDGKKNNSFLFIENSKGETLRGTRLVCVPYQAHKNA